MERAAGPWVKRFLLSGMWRAESPQHIPAGAVAWVDKARLAELLEGSVVDLHAVALHIRRTRPATIWAFLPLEAKPMQILVHRGDKFRLASRAIEIFQPEQQLPTRGACAFLGRPESAGVPQVEMARG